ncbi:MAG TPA: PHP domain-containing protein [Actinomycetaceae bacterium]|nr:PHP domain-containing protein [Actinomycetaceae bacterium]
MFIDLHTHSAHSDGTDAPARLMEAAAVAGLEVVGLADHDTNTGWAEASAAVGRTGVALVRAAEITASWKGSSVHVLSYLHDPDEPRLARLMADNRNLRPRRARAMVAALSRDYPITWEDVMAHAGDPKTVGRPHMADALVTAGVFPHRDDAFAGVLAADGPYYVHLAAPEPLEVVRAIRAAGGVPVIAHPFISSRGGIDDDAIAELARAGLFALEADHRDHTAGQRARARRLAADLGLAVTGSSDYHGTGKQNRLGDGVTAPDVLERIAAEGRLEVLWPG